MTPTRLRPRWSDDVLATLYAQPHDHNLYGRGHGDRVQKMIDHGVALVRAGEPITSIADLSCGNGHVARTIAAECNSDVHVILGDFAPGYPYVGPIERTVDRLSQVNLFVCGETIEHLDDPEAVLRQVHDVTRWLVLSTPVENWNDTNAEHYWAWSANDVTKMLQRVDFTVVKTDEVDSRPYGEPYLYGIWTAHVTRM